MLGFQVKLLFCQKSIISNEIGRLFSFLPSDDLQQVNIFNHIFLSLTNNIQMIHNFVKITILRVSYSKIHFLYFVITNFRCMFFFILTTDLICSVSFLPNKLKSILEVKGKCHKFYFNVLWSAFILFNFLSREAI